MPAETPTPVSHHTLQSLCDELLLGRAVASDDGAIVCALANGDERAVFSWLVRNRAKWPQNNTKADVELMAASLNTPPTPHRPTVAAAPRTRRIWRLRSVRAHRFAGLQLFGELTNAPPVFEFRPANGITVIQGENGAGKTSLLNAVMWCLTGHIARPQRPPEQASLSLRVDIASTETTAASSESAPLSCAIAAVVPMPSGALIAASTGGAVPLDTWVEVKLVDQESGEEVSLRRAVTRNARGNVVEEPPPIESLGIDPAALAIGTTMPALIPHIRLNEASDLGKAVAALTGLSPLRDLTVYVQKSIQKLDRDLPLDRDADLVRLDVEYAATRRSLSDLLVIHPTVGAIGAVPESLNATNCAVDLAQVKTEYADKLSRMLASASSILGNSFDANNAMSANDLATNVGPALGTLDIGQLRALPSLRTSGALAGVNQALVSAARAEVARILAQANDFADLLASPERAARVKLYAALGSWSRDTGKLIDRECPVCSGSLDGVEDPVTHTRVSEELSSQGEVNEHLARPLAGWASDAASRLRAKLPVELHAVLEADLPANPAAYLRAGLVDELFTQQRFRGVLAALRNAHEVRVDTALAMLPPFVEPILPILPAMVSSSVSELGLLLGRVVRLCAFADWRNAHGEEWKQAVLQIVGNEVASTPNGATTTLRASLVALDKLVKDATPLRESAAKIAALEALLDRRAEIVAKKQLYQRTAAALSPVLTLGSLVEAQISALVSRLSAKTEDWKDRLYTPSISGAPRTVSADVSASGSLSAIAVREGASARADEVSNASDLRATLLAFLLAFWEETLASRGGLATLLFDDIQDLFDEANQRRVANALLPVLEVGGQVVLVTFHRLFRGRVYKACRQRGAAQCSCLRLHPVNGARRVVALVPFIEDVEEKRREFEKDENENIAQPARDYLNGLRIYLEENLKDLFTIGDASLGDDSTLSDLIGAIRRRVNSGMDVFNGTQFRDFVNDVAVSQGSDFLRLMNESHHSQASAVTYVQVQEINPECERICGKVHQIHEEYERWMRRDPGEERPVAPAPPTPLSLPSRLLPIRAVAAISDAAPHAEGEETGESIDLAGLDHHAIYLINCDNLGFAIPRGWCALVDLTAGHVPDGAYVVALHRDLIYARRLLRNRQKPEVLTLSSDAPPGTGRPPTLVLPTHETTVLRIVGLFRLSAPPLVRTGGEAVRLNDGRVIASAQYAFRVEGDSAAPLALDGQIVLGSHQMTDDEIERRKGGLVVIKTNEGAYFKRIGEAVPGADHVRQFEAIGGLGDSVLARVGEIDDDPFVRIALKEVCVAIEGVLYMPPIQT